MDKDNHELEQKLFVESISDIRNRLSYFRRLERVWNLIETDYSDPDLTLEKAARVSGINKNHLNVLLRQTITLTFHQLLVRYRLFKAMDMMKHKNYSILEVALESGFGSLNTFERNFRNLIGLTPKVFKSEVIQHLSEILD